MKQYDLDEDAESAPRFVVDANDFKKLHAVLTEIVGQKNPNRWGYDAAAVAMDDNWRTRARALL